jgi:TonB family protein
VNLLKDARFRPAIRARWAVIIVAILAVSLLCFLAPDSAVAFGTAQSGNAQINSGAEAARAVGQRISPTPSGPRESTSAYRRTVIPTRENLQLTVRADCASVEIFTDAQYEVSYGVRLDPKATGTDADALRRNLSLTARDTPRGIVLIGPPGSEADCRVHPTYEIHVPRRYALDIAVRSGDIAAGNLDGVITFATGGGNIRVGSVGPREGEGVFKGSDARTFIVRLETGGGDISVSDVAGGLRAATAGGQISAGDVRGPAVLRTGGGDIHVGHVFGIARFASGGGDITVQKVDGGLWADTAGGRIEIGNPPRMSAISPGFPAGERGTFPAAVAPADHEQRVMLAVGDSVDVTEFARLFDAFVWGGVRVDPADQQKRLVNAIAPEYPDVARLAGIEGEVTLRILVASDGSVRGITPVSGPPILARAAVRAVERWRYAPALVEGHPIDVVTTVTLAFRLHP